MKKVKRKYISKKTGKLVVKEYTYNYKNLKAKKGKLLVNAKGKINKKNLNAYIDEIRNSSTLTQAEKKSLEIELKAWVNQKAADKSKLTTTGFEGHLQYDELSRLFANIGYTADELAAAYGFSLADLTNPDNWHGGIYTDPATGKEYKVNIDYHGSVFVEI